MDQKYSKNAMQIAEESALFLFSLYLISAIYRLKRLNKVKQFIFNKSSLLITRSSWIAFLEHERHNWYGSNRSSVLAAKVYFSCHLEKRKNQPQYLRSRLLFMGFW